VIIYSEYTVKIGFEDLENEITTRSCDPAYGHSGTRTSSAKYWTGGLLN